MLNAILFDLDGVICSTDEYHGAEFLGVRPEECLVVEDAVSGAEAGHRGGFPVACVGDASTAGAGDFNLTSFGQLTEVAARLRKGADA